MSDRPTFDSNAYTREAQAFQPGELSWIEKPVEKGEKFEYKHFARIQRHGDKTEITFVPVETFFERNGGENKRYEPQYKAWKDSLEAVPDGFPIALAPCFRAVHVEILKALGIRTVEQAVASAEKVSQVLPDGKLVVANAKNFLAYTKGEGAEVARLTKELEGLKAENKQMWDDNKKLVTELKKYSKDK